MGSSLCALKKPDRTLAVVSLEWLFHRKLSATLLLLKIESSNWKWNESVHFDFIVYIVKARASTDLVNYQINLLSLNWVWCYFLCKYCISRVKESTRLQKLIRILRKYFKLVRILIQSPTNFHKISAIVSKITHRIKNCI